MISRSCFVISAYNLAKCMLSMPKIQSWHTLYNNKMVLKVKNGKPQLFLTPQTIY